MTSAILYLIRSAILDFENLKLMTPDLQSATLKPPSSNFVMKKSLNANVKKIESAILDTPFSIWTSETYDFILAISDFETFLAVICHEKYEKNEFRKDLWQY